MSKKMGNMIQFNLSQYPIVAATGDVQVCFSGCLICDLLSYVVQNGQRGMLWLTHHTHPNIVAVASLKELAAVMVVGGGRPEPETFAAAAREGVLVLTTSLQAYDVAKIIAKLDRGGLDDDSM